MTIMNNLINGTTAPNLNTLKNDMVILKNDGAAIAQHLNENASNFSHEAMGMMMSKAKDGMRSAETHIKNKPSQSMAIAFVAGIAASYLLFSRR
jgi:ElaB/YqjD/DUF883 family membrane-anchored ribosome-binding protein